MYYMFQIYFKKSKNETVKIEQFNLKMFGCYENKAQDQDQKPSKRTPGKILNTKYISLLEKCFINI